MNRNFYFNAKRIYNKEQLFSITHGYDTPKKLNRSNEYVKPEILEEIEQGITLERLKSLDLPIYVYKTQITIHGQFDELTKQRIGGYKLVFQNKNKSIGIKWTAIDYQKKREIYAVLQHLGYEIVHNSNEYYAIKAIHYDEHIYDKVKEEYDRIDVSLIIGDKYMDVSSIPYLGKFYVIKLEVNAILQDNVWKFIEKSFNMTKQQWNDIQLQKEKERKERDRQYELEFQKFKEEREKNIHNSIKKYKSIYTTINTFEDIPNNDCIMLYINEYGQEFLIKKYSDKNNNVIFQHMRNNTYDTKLGGMTTINKMLKKYICKEESVKKIFNTKTIFLVNVISNKIEKIKENN